MPPLQQEIVIKTTKSVLQVFLLSLADQSSGKPYFLSEVLYRIPEFSPFSNVFAFSTHYPDSDSAFKAAFSWVQWFANSRGEPITGIDNPCNCPFLSSAAQQSIISGSGVAVNVLLNGK